MNQHLFLFTLGPVQSFIAQARKTHDLYAGSRILSELIKTGIEKVCKKHTIIFPFADDYKRVESLPNRFLALVKDETDLAQLGQSVEKAVKDKWEQIAHTGIVTTVVQTNCSLSTSYYQQQIDHHLEIHWLFEEYTEGSDYSDSFKRIEQKLGAIKNVRPFEQFNYNGLGEKGRKCSVDGFRNVKFYRKSENQYRNSADVRKTFLFANDNCIFEHNDPKMPYSILQQGEGLSAVSFLKRCYERKKNGSKSLDAFESTAEIALLKVIQFLKTKDESLEDFEENPQLFFKDNLTENYFKKQGLPVSDIPDYEKRLKRFEELAKAEKTEIKFSKYYAVLAFDGDSMGEYLSKADSWENHQKFSKLLIGFAKKAKAYLDGESEGSYINEKGKELKWEKVARGRSVYAGGDDFLGFINLEYLFEVLIWMRDNFKKEISNESPFEEELTFSAGICVAHYKEPLSIVLNRARQMEHKAKDWRKDKNAFGIAVIKGSGEDHETVWGFDNQSLENIQFLVDEMRRENVSNTFLRSFQVEFRKTLDVGNFMGADDLVKAELGRLILRGLNSKFNRDEKKQKRDELLPKIWEQLFIQQDSKLDNYFSLLNICDFLHRTLNSLTSNTPEYA